VTQTLSRLRAAGPLPRRPRRVDFSSRLKGRLRALGGRLDSRAAVIEAVREANATLDPRGVADWIVRQAQDWIPAPCWVVVASDQEGRLDVMADVGLTPALGPSLWSAANWVVRHATEFYSGDLSKDVRGGPGAVGSVVAFPLICRSRAIGALVGLDPAPSSTTPSLGSSLAMAVRTVLEPSAIALHNALALQKAEALSVTDDLTLLYNSRYLNQVLRRETKRAARGNRPLAVLFLDLDGFKQVNDRHGHLAGSKALVEAAAIIRSCARETDIVARFGGDEFAVVLPETGRDGATALAARIRERLDATTFLASEGLDVRLTVSIGVAAFPDVAASAEELLRAADMAMYRVKAQGKDGIHVARERELD
jgi:diguanylate cyclase (GGDEF)-like protein